MLMSTEHTEAQSLLMDYIPRGQPVGLPDLGKTPNPHPHPP